MTTWRTTAHDIFVPGRVNLIGEHTDYNGGCALPFAIDLGVAAVRVSAHEAGLTGRSAGFGQWRHGEEPDADWSRRVAKMAAALHVVGGHVEMSSTLPEGAGLSSSAAALGALALVWDAPGSLLDVAMLVRDCEASAQHAVGLLDPVATLGARSGHALLIDFATLSFTDVEIPATLGFTVVHSGETRTLASSGYATRRTECAAARAYLEGEWAHVTANDLTAVPAGVLRRRARHVVSESQRVRHTVDALRAHDDRAVGELVSASHQSLRDDFAVSTPGVDAAVAALTAQPGVYGARLIGGGFGGCILVVHDRDHAPDVAGRASWVVRPSAGAFERERRAR